MSKIIVDSLEANGGIPVNVDADLIANNKLTVLGASGVTADIYYGSATGLTNLPTLTFTGNTSGSCIQNLWVDYLYGCNGLLNINGDVNVTGFLSADTFYGDSSNLTRPINQIIPNGSGITDVSAYLEYGVNLISTATTGDFCVRLPLTPIEGREVVVINNSGFDIYVFPSMDGGSINGTLNFPVIVPSDGLAYTFTCFENPNPGQWSSNILAAPGQYDSGVISVDTSAGNGYVSAYDDNYKNSASQFTSVNAYQSLLRPYILYTPNPSLCGSQSGLCAVVFFKPVTPWSFIDKITVYTNFTSSVTQGGSFGLVFGKEKGYYSAGTIDWLTSENLSSGNIGTPAYGGADLLLSGSPLISTGGYTPLPGEPGTYYGELIYSAATRPAGIGDVLLTSGTMYIAAPVFDTVNADVYESKYIGFIFDTNNISQDVKFRFLIDYTII